ncbi:hypothetical protein BEWA_054920 [Theileria equi strain WA]|uniref:Signal peptide containing protein n=1 Tax=Theileria equi strain WA TaxID=1537102 RepID=L1LDW1_THEEQ|nr:hypothetical protein BEWA_054920 [Theileria equi strain WA]EKX73435.1 hypothetical protein BEWA_054920 [Theileria equi strain WA]|eukprot:XP_004832887.1 hypothetical protein BEWA_054920 [Theileria equi strain WA]
MVVFYLFLISNLHTLCSCGDTEERRDGPQEVSSNTNRMSSFRTINLADPSPNVCKVLDLISEYGPVRVHVPVNERVVGRVINDLETVWNSSEQGEVCLYCITFPKGTNHLVVIIAKETPLGLDHLYFKRKGGGWKSSTKGYIDKIPKLKHNKNPNYTTTLNISTELQHCHIVRESLYGVSVSLYFSREDYQIQKVVDDTETIWQAEDEKNEKLFIAQFYSRQNAPPMLLIWIMKRYVMERLHYVKKRRTWDKVPAVVFNETFAELKRV